MNRKGVSDDDRYLLFWVGAELFATPLMGVREVVELQKIKPIPHTVKSYLGVINIRGEIVGAIDMRIRFGLSPSESRLGAMMVFETPSGSIAAVTDRLDGVVKIDPSNIDLNPRIEAKIPVSFLIGVGKINDRLVTIIDLGKVLDAEEVATIGASRNEVQTAI